MRVSRSTNSYIRSYPSILAERCRCVGRTAPPTVSTHEGTPFKEESECCALPIKTTVSNMEEPDGSTKQACLLEARISEVQMLESVKFESRSLVWRLRQDGVIERWLDTSDSQLELPPHNLSSITQITISSRSSRVKLVESLPWFQPCSNVSTKDGSPSRSGFLHRSFIWVAQFSTVKEAKKWYFMCLTIKKAIERNARSVPSVSNYKAVRPVSTSKAQRTFGTPSQPQSTHTFAERKPQATPLIVEKVKSQGDFEEISQEESKSENSGMSSSRRYVILRGGMEKQRPRHISGLHFGIWSPVTWILYNNGILEEFAKDKKCHDLMNRFALDELDVRSTRQKFRKENYLGSIPPMRMSTKNNNCLLKVERKFTEKTTYIYRAPNKLMQIQWLSALSTARLSGSLFSSDDGDSFTAKARIPRKLSVMQERCLADIFGVIVRLWVNVIWEHSEPFIIRRRYEDPNRTVVKQVTNLEDLIVTRADTIAIPLSSKSRHLPKNILYQGHGHWTFPRKSKRRLTIQLFGGDNPDETICIRAGSQQLRDEWLAILHKLQEDTPIDVGPSLEGVEEFLQTVVAEEKIQNGFKVSKGRQSKSTMTVPVQEKLFFPPECLSLPAVNIPRAVSLAEEGTGGSFSASQSGRGDEERLFYPTTAEAEEWQNSFSNSEREVSSPKKRSSEVEYNGVELLKVVPRLSDHQRTVF